MRKGRRKNLRTSSRLYPWGTKRKKALGAELQETVKSLKIAGWQAGKGTAKGPQGVCDA
jgi:hypothetical protein